MTKKTDDTNSKEKKPNYIAIGMVLGLSIGALAGVVLFDNVATGAAIGISLGICFGAASETMA